MKSKFKRKSMQFCDSAIKFAEELEHAEELVESLDESKLNDKESRDSKLRRLKDSVELLKNYALDSSVDAKELDELATEDAELKMKSSKVKDEFSKVNDKVIKISDEVQAINTITENDDDTVNFSKVINTRFTRLRGLFSELKTKSEEAADVVEDLSNEFNEDELKKDINNMDFSENKKKLDESILKIEEKISDDETLKEFAKELDTIKEMNCDTEDEFQEKLEKMEEFCDKLMNFNEDSEEEIEEEKSEFDSEEVNNELNDALENMKNYTKNFSEEIDALIAEKATTEEECEDKCKKCEELKEKIEEEFAENSEVEDTNISIDDTKAQELSECIDKMEDILQSMDVEEKDQIVEEFAKFEKRLGNFCDCPTKKTKDEIDESIEVIEEFSKKVKTFAAKRSFSKLGKCFATVKEITDFCGMKNFEEEEDSEFQEDVIEEVPVEEAIVKLEEYADKMETGELRNFSKSLMSLIKTIAFAEDESEDEESEELEEVEVITPNTTKIKTKEVKVETTAESDDQDDDTEDESEEVTEEEVTDTEVSDSDSEDDDASEKVEKEVTEEVSDEEAANFSKVESNGGFMHFYN